jgi:hypothetical protein
MSSMAEQSQRCEKGRRNACVLISTNAARSAHALRHRSHCADTPETLATYRFTMKIEMRLGTMVALTNDRMEL